MASNGKREYKVQASDYEEAIDLAKEEATRSNRLIRVLHPNDLEARALGGGWFKVTMYVMEAAR